MPSIDLASKLQSQAKAWVVRPPDGDEGVIRVRVLVDPNLPSDPDLTWLAAQLELSGVGRLEPTTLLWGPTDAERT